MTGHKTSPVPGQAGAAAWRVYGAVVRLYGTYQESVGLLSTATTTGAYRRLWGRVLFDWQALQWLVDDEIIEAPGVWESVKTHVILDGEHVPAPVSDYPELTATVTPKAPAGGNGERVQADLHSHRVTVDDPPCQRRRWHTSAHPLTNDRAVQMCLSCPVIRECAKAGLMAGTSLDGSFTRPANDVVQGGVVCRGDKATAVALAEVAGVEVPQYRDHKPRFTAPDHCIQCAEPMVTRNRKGTPPPAGTVQHMAGGVCINCYAKAKNARNAAQVAA